MNLTAAPTTDVRTFDADLQEVMRRVRGAFAAILNGLPVQTARLADIHRVLDINKSLAWRIVKVAQGTDPFASAQHLPGPAALESFLRAAAKKGVQDSLIEAARESVEDFERMSTLHAGDRDTLLIMLGGFARDGRDQIELAHRELMFRGGSQVWGVQAKVQLRADFIAPSNARAGTPREPSGSADLVDIASLRSFIDLRRLRPNASWVVSRTGLLDDQGEHMNAPTRVPIAGDHAPNAVPLMSEFCSRPMPQLRRLRTGDGFVFDEIIEGPVGNTAAMTLVMGDVTLGAAKRWALPNDQEAAFACNVRTPCEWLIFDMFVHEGTLVEQPTGQFFAELGADSVYRGAEGDRNLIPMALSVEHVSREGVVMHVPEVPRYSDMVARVFDRMGWDRSRFDLYRLRVAYPPMPTVAVMTGTMTARPQ